MKTSKLVLAFDNEVVDREGAINSKLDEMFELLDANALRRAAKVLAEKVQTRGKNNWRKTNDIDGYVGRAIRHLYIYLEQKRSGQTIEAGDHLANAMCRVMFAMGLEADKKPAIPKPNPMLRRRKR